MRSCKNILAMLAAAAAFSGCSSADKVAGNSAETGSPELAGILVLNDGKLAAHAHVQCVPEGYDATSDKALPTAFVTETDENGYYSLDSVPDGTYALEAFHEKSGKRLLVQGVKVTEDDSLAVSDTLRAPGVVKIKGPGSLEEGATGVATVLGTTIHRTVKVSHSVIVVDSLPAGSLNLRVIFGREQLSPLTFEKVKVVAGDTETVVLPSVIEPDAGISWDSVSFNFVAPLALPKGTDTLTSFVSNIPIAIRLTADNFPFDSIANMNGRWEAVRISKNGNRSKKLPISYPDFDKRAKEAVLWVNVDSLNVGDSLELSYDGLQYSVYARDVFPTNRSYSLVWHFGNALSPVTDASEYGYFDGSALSSVYSDAFVDGAVGGGIKFDSAYYFYVDNSAKPDSARKVNLNFDGSGYFCFSVWVKLDAVDKEQTIFEKAKEYALRFDPAKGFVVELWVPGADSDSVKYAWASGKSSVKAGEWTYIAFSHHTNSQANFYVNDLKVESDPEETAWTDARNLTDFKVGGFAGVIDELMLGGCFRDDSWTRLTYLNQRPDNYWPVVTPR